MAEHFSLRWNNFHRNMSSGFRTLLMEDSLVDVTLAADGRFVQAHRLILSVCSPYFKKLFSTTPCSHPIVVMKDVHFKQLTDILSFMYQGEVNVHQEELADFLKTAELLQIRGLAEQNVEDVNVTTFKHASSQSACSESSGTLPSNSQSVLSQGTQSHVRLNRTAFEQKLSAQVGSSANRVPAAAQSMLHQRSSTSNLAPQISMKQGPSTSMFIGVQVKEELPDVPSEVDQDIDAHEYLTGESGVDGTSLDAPDVLGIGEAEPTHVVEKNLCTAPSGQDGSSAAGRARAAAAASGAPWGASAGASADASGLSPRCFFLDASASGGAGGAALLALGGHLFRLARRRGAREYWRCALAQRSGCRGYARTEARVLPPRLLPAALSHNHPPLARVPPRLRAALDAAAGEGPAGTGCKEE